MSAKLSAKLLLILKIPGRDSIVLPWTCDDARMIAGRIVRAADETETGESDGILEIQCPAAR